MSDGQKVEYLIEEARKLPNEDYRRLVTELLSEPKNLERLLEILADSNSEQRIGPAGIKVLKYWAEQLCYLALREGSALHKGSALHVGDTKHRITELRGLGKEIWQAEDAQGYVDAERESWNN